MFGRLFVVGLRTADKRFTGDYYKYFCIDAYFCDVVLQIEIQVMGVDIFCGFANIELVSVPKGNSDFKPTADLP